MRLPDPYALRLKVPRETVVFAAGQTPGNKRVQEDYVLHFNDECFVMADGADIFPHGDVAAKFACETAIWAFKHIRQHRYYWMDKKLFMKRIFRSTNLAVWQKRREAEFADGLATSLLVLIVGAKQYWLGSAGDSSAWLLHRGVIRKLTADRSVFQDAAPDLLGIKRLGLIPHFWTGEFAPGDMILLASAGCANYVMPTDLQTCAASVGNTADDASKSVAALLDASETNGSTDNATAVLVKRISDE